MQLKVFVTWPAGNCPHKLKSCAYDDVIEWCELVISTGRQTDRVYSAQALIYWLRDFIPMHDTVSGYSVDYLIAKANILTYFESKQGHTP